MPHTSVYIAFCAVNAVIPATQQNSAQGFAVAFLAICFVLPPLCGGCICLYCTTCATPGRCTGQHSRPIIIMYIRALRLLWIHARRCSISQTMQARRGLIPLCADRWQVLRPAACNLAPVSGQGAPAGTLHPAGQSSSRGAAGSAEPLAALAADFFGLSPDSQ